MEEGAVVGLLPQLLVLPVVATVTSLPLAPAGRGALSNIAPHVREMEGGTKQTHSPCSQQPCSKEATLPLCNLAGRGGAGVRSH